MFELLFCSMLTVLPDYLFRRYRQGKRFGKEITLFSVWYELRWGITACVLLTISLITVVFYYHPASNNVTSFFRTVPVLPETGGRVSEIYVGLNEEVEAGQPLFRLDSSAQQATLDTARLKVEQIDAQMAVAEADLVTADARIQEADGAYNQALEELNTKVELQSRNADVVSTREIDKLQNVVDGRFGTLSAARSSLKSLEVTVRTLLPAQRAVAVGQVAEAQAELDKTVIYAGVSGYMQQFSLRIGDYVNPMLRPAGILVPKEAGRMAFQAGFGQISAQVLKVGMTAEMACASRPFTVIPMVVTEFQNVISSGQLRQTDLLIDSSQITQPGTVLVYMEPMYEGGIDGIPPGSTCMANAYTSNYDRLHSDEEMSTTTRIALHAIDTVGLVHAMLLRLQVLITPVRTLVLSGGH